MGAQNRPQELREEIKNSNEKKKKQKRRKNKHQEANRRSKNNVFDLKRIVVQWPGGMRGVARRNARGRWGGI